MRSDRRTQKLMNKEIDLILDTKNKGLDTLNLMKENINYPVIKDYLDNNYSQNG